MDATTLFLIIIFVYGAGTLTIKIIDMLRDRKDSKEIEILRDRLEAAHRRIERLENKE